MSIQLPPPHCFENGPRSIPSRWQPLMVQTLSYDVPALSAVRTRRLSVTAVGKGPFPSLAAARPRTTPLNLIGGRIHEESLGESFWDHWSHPHAGRSTELGGTAQQ